MPFTGGLGREPKAPVELSDRQRGFSGCRQRPENGPLVRRVIEASARFDSIRGLDGSDLPRTTPRSAAGQPDTRPTPPAGAGAERIRMSGIAGSAPHLRCAVESATRETLQALVAEPLPAGTSIVLVIGDDSLSTAATFATPTSSRCPVTQTTNPQRWTLLCAIGESWP